MVKATKSHGLDRKYKPWRKGKSENAKSKKGTLKSQLRGQQRLLSKATDATQKQAIESKIFELEGLINEKLKRDREREHAKKSHGHRFLERQRLTRLERTTRSNPNLANMEEELNKIALDMVYVAHYPHDMRYIPLFRKGVRIVDSGRPLARRGTTRKRIIEQLHKQEEIERVAWISEEMYKRLPQSWSIQQERDCFGEGIDSKTTQVEVHDGRFAVAPTQCKLLEAMDAIESQIDKEINEQPKNEHLHRDDESSSDGEVSIDSDDDSEADAIQNTDISNQEIKKKTSEGDSRDNDSDSDSGSSKGVQRAPQDVEPDDDSPTSTSSDSSDEDSFNSSDHEDKKEKTQGNPGIDLEDDPFLVTTDKVEDDKNIFAKAKRHIPGLDEMKGDKSKGWATQRQRPGQFKKRRMRN